jgi:hypothetical protein
VSSREWARKANYVSGFGPDNEEFVGQGGTIDARWGTKGRWRRQMDVINETRKTRGLYGR